MAISMNLDVNLKIYNEVKDIIYKYEKDILITFQGIDMIEKQSINIRGYNSYEWIKNRLGYYPVWTIRIPKEYINDLNYIKSSLGAIFATGSEYMYILDADVLECIDMDLYAWCEVHSIENNGVEEDMDEEVQANYNKDWRSFLCDFERNEYSVIQTVIPRITEKSVIGMFLVKEDGDRVLEKVSI